MTTIPLVVSIISLSLCVSGFFFLRWYISQRTDASRLLEEYRDEVYRLISEIDAATDRDSRLVEERIKNLRKLLDDTDKRISVYTRELQRSRNSEAIYKNLGRGIREALDSIPAAQTPVAPEAPPAESAPPVKTESPAAPEVSPEEASPAEPAAAKKTPHAKKVSSEETAELPFDEEKSSHAGSAKRQKRRKKADKNPPAARPEKSGIKMQIAQMALQGLSPSEIASSLKISLAEVDLALKLLKIGTGE
jgi:hypothetical protein